MPTYEYECSKCKNHFDAFQLMSAKPYTTCPEESCKMKKWGKGKVKRLLGAGAGLLFKGSGFYITDYRSEGYKKSAKSESPSSPAAKPSEKTSTSSTDSVKSKAPSAAGKTNEKKSSPKKS
jgi:putative FmdB family regulatory protein